MEGRITRGNSRPIYLKKKAHRGGVPMRPLECRSIYRTSIYRTILIASFSFWMTPSGRGA